MRIVGRGWTMRVEVRAPPICAMSVRSIAAFRHRRAADRTVHFAADRDGIMSCSMPCTRPATASVAGEKVCDRRWGLRGAVIMMKAAVRAHAKAAARAGRGGVPRQACGLSPAPFVETPTRRPAPCLSGRQQDRRIGADRGSMFHHLSRIPVNLSWRSTRVRAASRHHYCTGGLQGRLTTS